MNCVTICRYLVIPQQNAAVMRDPIRHPPTLPWNGVSLPVYKGAGHAWGHPLDYICHSIAGFDYVIVTAPPCQASLDETRLKCNCADGDAVSLEVDGQRLHLLIRGRFGHAITYCVPGVVWDW